MEFLTHLENALLEYSSEGKLEVLIKARDLYFSQTGKINEEDLDYEGRMNCFNDWFLMQYKISGDGPSVFEDYIGRHGQEVENSFSCNHSVFEYLGTNRKKQHVLKDLLHGKKVILSSNEKNIALIKGDIFIGRVLENQDGLFLMAGVCPLPHEAQKIITKNCKKIQKLKDINAEYDFLIQLEALKTKYMRFQHVDVKKIFIFDS